MDGVQSTITIYKRRIAPDQKWAARDLLRAHLNGSGFRGGQLILHFDPAGNPIFVEIQERRDQLQNLPLDKQPAA
jgi:hypothetical protein